MRRHGAEPRGPRTGDVQTLLYRGTATVAVGIAFVAACGGGQPARHPAAPAAVDAGGSEASTAAAIDDLPSLDALAARGSRDAPLMREVLRANDAKQVIAFTAAADSCYRAVVAASAEVQVTFEDATQTARGPATAATAGVRLVPPQGPACARRGETFRLVVSPPDRASIVRAVVWQSP